MISRIRSLYAWFAYGSASILAAVLLIAAWGLVAHGSALAIPALAQGYTVLASPTTKEMGILEACGRYVAGFELINLGSRSVVVNGIRTSCTCVSTDVRLPLEIPARGRKPLRLWVQPREAQAGKALAQSVELILSAPGSRTTLSVAGTVKRSLRSE